MSRRAMWIIIGVLLALYLAAAAAISLPAASPALPSGTSYSTAADGTKALFTLFQHRPGKGAARLLVEPQSGLIETDEILMVQPSVNLETKTARAWVQLVQHGVSLIVLTSQQNELLNIVGLKLHFLPRGFPGKSLHLRTSNRLLPNIAAAPANWVVYTPGLAAYLNAARPGDQSWIAEVNGQPFRVGITRRLGAGIITVLTVPQLSFNKTIASAQNLEVLLALLDPAHRQVGFVETVHGFESTPGVIAVFGGWLRTSLLFALLAMIMWVWAEGRRFGGVRMRTDDPASASLHYALTISSHYRRGYHLSTLSENLRALIRRRVATAANRPNIRAHVTRQEYVRWAREVSQQILEMERSRRG